MELSEQIKSIAFMLSRFGVYGFSIAESCDRQYIIYNGRAWLPNPVQSASLQATVIKENTSHKIHIIASLSLDLDLMFEDFKMVYRATESTVHFIDEIEYAVVHKTSKKQYIITRMLCGGLDQVMHNGEALTTKNPVVKALCNQFDELISKNESKSFIVRERNWRSHANNKYLSKIA